jgi:hypothetical protein
MDINDEVRQAVAREVRQAVAKRVAIGVAIFTGFIVFIAVGGLVVRLLWNWLLPPIFGLREITFWQGLGLLALCRILFGGHGRGGGSYRGPRRARREWWRESDSAPSVSPCIQKGPES